MDEPKFNDSKKSLQIFFKIKKNSILLVFKKSKEYQVSASLIRNLYNGIFYLIIFIYLQFFKKYFFKDIYTPRIFKKYRSKKNK